MSKAEKKPLYILPWVMGRGVDEDEGFALFEDWGFSVHRNLPELRRFIAQKRSENVKGDGELLRDDFPWMVSVPSKSWWYAHNITAYCVSLPLTHAFHRAIQAQGDQGIEFDKYDSHTRVKELFPKADYKDGGGRLAEWFISCFGARKAS